MGLDEKRESRERQQTKPDCSVETPRGIVLERRLALVKNGLFHGFVLKEQSHAQERKSKVSCFDGGLLSVRKVALLEHEQDQKSSHEARDYARSGQREIGLPGA